MYSGIRLVELHKENIEVESSSMYNVKLGCSVFEKGYRWIFILITEV